MKYAFSSNGFLRHSLTDTIRILANIGYQGIEIMADVPHAYPTHLRAAHRAEIRTVLRDHRMEISNINAFMHNADGDTYHPSWIEKDPGQRMRRVEYTLNCIDLAEQLGARTLSTEPGGPLEGISREEGFRFFREGLAAIEDRAREKGIRILIEPEPGLLIENSRQFLEFFELLDPEVFGLNFDIGHFFCVGEDPQSLIPLMKSVIGHFHLEDIAASRIHHHLIPGEGAIDFPAVLDAIRSIEFEGYVTVELYTYESKAVEAAREAFRFLRKVNP
jgi:fructoselysine 3-epimerase